MSLRAGFESLERETQVDTLSIEGDIPAWLQGSLIRTGPAKFEVGDESYRHWFDGLGMLHAFQFQGGDVSYANRFIESGSYCEARDEGRIVRSEFGTDPCRSIFKRAAQILSPDEVTDNANINVTKLAGQYVSMTETPPPIAFDDETLETEGYFEFDDDVDGDVTTAHPHRDTDRSHVYNYLTAFGRRSTYRIYRQPFESRTREVISEIDVNTPRYMHSFGASQQYVILVEFPVVIYPLQMVFRGETFAEHLIWEPDRGTRIRVIDKESGELVGTGTTEPFFAFHHINAFEQDGELVVDLVAYPDTGIIDDLYLDELRNETTSLVAGQMRRLRMSPEAENIRHERLFDEYLELPRIHPSRVGRRHRHVWAGSQGESAPFVNQIAAFDLDDREVSTWHEPSCYPGEPIFVERPDAEAEDDGVLLSIVLDTDEETSFLLVLDAATLEPIGRARVSHHVPFGFHAQYFDEGPEVRDG